MITVKRIAALAVLLPALALAACASKKDVDALRTEVQQAKQSAADSATAAQQAAADARAAAEKVDRVYSRSLRK